MPRKQFFQLRRDTAANWASTDPVLGAGEPGWDTTNGILKIGDGTTAWTALTGEITTADALAGDVLFSDGGEAVFSRHVPLGTTVASTSGTATFVGMVARRTASIGNVWVTTSSTAAAATPTLCKVAVYEIDANGDATRVAISANDTTLFSVVNTSYTIPLTASFTKVAGQHYMVGLLVISAAALPTFYGPVFPNIGGLNTGYNGRLPKTTATKSGETDLQASYTAANLVGTNRSFQALLLP